jgi:hypothetical protein
MCLIPGLIKPNTLTFVFATSPVKHATRVRPTSGWLGIRIMCPSVVKWLLLTDCCFSELAYKDPTKRICLVQSKHQHDLIQCNLFSSWYGWNIAHLGLSNNHSLLIWSYDSWIYNYLCKKCLSPIACWARITLRRAVLSIQHNVIKFVGDLWQVVGFIRVPRIPPPIKLTATTLLKYCWKWRWTP